MPRILPRFSLRTLVLFTLLATSATGLWWNWEPWAVVERLPGAVPYYRSSRVVFSPAGELLAVVSGRVVYLRDLRTRRRLRPFVVRLPRLAAPGFFKGTLGYAYVHSVAFSLDAELMAVAWAEGHTSIDGRDVGETHVSVLRVADLETVFRQKLPWVTEVPEIGFAMDGRSLVVMAGPHMVSDEVDAVTVFTTRRYDLASGEVTDTHTLRGPVMVRRSWLALTSKISPDGRFRVEFGLDGVWRLLRRRRPDQWWGALWLWEFWLTAALGALFMWSRVADWRRLRTPASQLAA